MSLAGRILTNNLPMAQKENINTTPQDSGLMSSILVQTGLRQDYAPQVQHY